MNQSARPWNVFPTLFGSVLGANILTMSIMNFFEAPTRYIPLVYLATVALMVLLILRCKFEPLPALSRREHLFCIAFALILCLPRVPYLLEGAVGYALTPFGDDDYHIPDLASIIHTDIFPPRALYDSDQYLGYYYAAWIPGAAIYHAGLASTVKGALVLLRLMYSFFLVYFPVYAAQILFTERKHRIVFLALVFLYGGFDFLYWLFSLQFVPVHAEWWANDFGLRLQFSNFFTLVLWTPQHLLAGLAVLFGLYVLAKSDNIAADALAGLCFLSAVFSSPYAVLGTIPLAVWFFLRLGKWRSVPIAALVFAIVSLPLWWILIGETDIEFKFLGSLQDMWSGRARAGFVVFLLVISLELGILIAAAAYFVRSQRQMLWPFILSVGYLLSTFFIWYHENYSMRGAIVPILTLTYLATPVIAALASSLTQLWWRTAAATYLLGGILEYSSFTHTAVLAFHDSDTPFHAAALRSNIDSNKMVSTELNADAARYSQGWHVLEKNRPVRKDPITTSEARLMHPDNLYRITLAKALDAFRH